MFIDTRAISFPMTEGILTHVESRLKSALAPFVRSVLRVTARLEDVNANRGGVDKRCGVVVALRRRGVVVVEATRADLYTAVDATATRVRRSVKRALTRHADRRRRSNQRPGAMPAI